MMDLQLYFGSYEDAFDLKWRWIKTCHLPIPKGPIQGSHWIVRGGFSDDETQKLTCQQNATMRQHLFLVVPSGGGQQRPSSVPSVTWLKNVMNSSRGTAFNATEMCHLWEIHGTTVAFLWLTVSDFWVYHGRSSAATWKWHWVFAPPCRWPMPRAPARKTGRPGRIWGAGEGTSRWGQESQVVHVGAQLVH